MLLSRFGVKNYKCLGDIDIPLTPIHVLIGPNDSGKTSLLEAMAAFCASSENSLAQVFPQPWSGRELVRQGAPTDSVEFRGEWVATGEGASTEAARALYGLSVVFPVEGNDCRGGSEFIAVDGNQIKSPFPGHSESALRIWRKNPTVQPAPPREQLEALAPLLKPAHKYALDPKLMAVPAAINPARKFRLDPDGFGLPTLLDDILGYNPELFIQLRNDFCRFFPQFRSVRVETENSLSRVFSPNGLHQSSGQIGKGVYFETQAGKAIRAQQASDGAVLFLGFLALAYLPEPPKLLLIEEPENGIYPKRLGEVIRLLKEMSQRTDRMRLPQIIISTHSPYVVSFFGPDEVTFLSRPTDQPDAPVRARPVRDAPHIRDRLAGDEFYLGELWYNLSEEELFGDA